MRSTSASQAVQPLPSPHRPRFVCPSLTGWHKRCPNSASFFTCARPIVAKAGSTNHGQRRRLQEINSACDLCLLFFPPSSTIDTALLPSILTRILPIIGSRISSRLAWPLHLCASPPNCPCRRPCQQAKNTIYGRLAVASAWPQSADGSQGSLGLAAGALRCRA